MAPSSTKSSCLVLGAGCAVLLLLQHQLLHTSPSSSVADLAPARGSLLSRASALGSLGARPLFESTLLVSPEGRGVQRAAGLSSSEEGEDELGGPSVDAAAAALASRAARALAAVVAASDADVSAEPHPDAALGGDMHDEPVLLREAAAVARELILVPTSFSYGHYTLNLLINLKR
ncbi:hypothetical protein T492DRAFT_915350 [Pavlovales sp. CCMP2436]|nr:hypothetical protein T492DRAFT_915350 [Pavlovales sp. CCMP2436]